MSTNQSKPVLTSNLLIISKSVENQKKLQYKSCSKLHLLSPQIFWEFFSLPNYFSWRIQFWAFIFILEKIWQRAHFSVVIFPPLGPAYRRPLATWRHTSLWPAPLTGLKPWACHAAVLPHLTVGMRLCLSVRPHRLSADRQASHVVKLRRRVRAPPNPAIYPTIIAPQSDRVHDVGVGWPVHRRSSHSSVPHVTVLKPSTVVAPSRRLQWEVGAVLTVYPGRDRHPREAVEPPHFPVPPRRPVRSLAVFSSTWGHILLHTAIPRWSHTSSAGVGAPSSLTAGCGLPCPLG
jgi:hypothetical protein